MPLLHGQVFFVESVCDDPDVIAANILVSVIPVTCRHSVCVCELGSERRKQTDLFYLRTFCTFILFFWENNLGLRGIH